MGVITFNGKASSAYNITVDTCPDYPAAQRKVEFISVDGRSGDLVRDTQAWNNVEQTYSVWYGRNNRTFQELASDVSMWLLGSKGYCRLEDDYYPDVYRMAVYSRMIQNRNFLNQKGRADLVFNCKPQRYLVLGESWQPLYAEDLVVNSYMPCYPIFRCYGNGTFTYDDTTVTVTNNAGQHIYIDTELQDAYTGDSTVDWSQAFNYMKQVWGTGTGSYRIEVPAAVALQNATIGISWRTGYGTQSGVTSIPLTSTATIPIGTNTGWSVSYTMGDTGIVLSYDTNDTGLTQASYLMWLTGAVSTKVNRNADISISGPMDPIPTGGSVLSYTGFARSDIDYKPRWWVL